MSYMKVLRSYRISTEMDLAVATEVSRRLNAHQRGSQAEVVEEYFMLGMTGGAAPETTAGLDTETQEAVKDLAAWWECDEADVIARTVARVHAATKAGRSAGQERAAPEGLEPESPRERYAARTPSMAASTFDNECSHCEKVFQLAAGRDPCSLCPDCFIEGHRNVPNCLKCVERAHFDKMRAKSTSCEPDNIEFKTDWGP